jgi:hypothetical protein
MKKMFIFVDVKLIHKMTITLDNTIEQLNIIKSVISNGLSYESYRQQILKDLQMATNEELNTPGSLPHYAHLNHARMNRLDKTIVLDEPTKTKLSQINNKYNWVLISEGWCGDASQIVPILQKPQQKIMPPPKTSPGCQQPSPRPLTPLPAAGTLM